MPAHVASRKYDALSRGITPAQLPGLAAWYSADYGVLTSVGPDVAATDGQTVRRWLDRSGNGRHMEQPTGAYQPTLSGGRIVFNAINTFLSAAGGPWSFAGGGAIFCVINPSYAASSGYGAIIAQHTGTGQSLFWCVQDYPNSGVRHTLDTFGNRSHSKESGALSVEKAESFSWDNWQTGGGISGATGKTINAITSTGSGSPSSLPAGAFRIGTTDFGPGAFYGGSIAEIVCLTSPYSVGALAPYFARKWGVAI